MISALTEHLFCVRTYAKPIKGLSTGSNTAVTSKSVGQERGYVYRKSQYRIKGEGVSRQVCMIPGQRESSLPCRRIKAVHWLFPQLGMFFLQTFG
jgi:hypothetical protein